MPRVTVIVATYNCSRVLKCALQSLRDQTFEDFEVWVVGDFCTDDSEQVVAAFADPRLHWTNLPQRAGSQYAPNNEGLRRAQGSLVAYLGHDDLWFPWHLETLIETIEREQADFAYAGVAFIGPEGPTEAYGDVKRNAHILPGPPSGWLHRKEIITKCGLWREPQSEPVGPDVGFQERAFVAGFRLVPSRNLSVMKFPSFLWSTYTRREDFPQESYFERLQSDAARLQRELLSELVFRYVSQCNATSVWEGLKLAFKAFRRKAGERYGVHRWPLSQYLRWMNARRRRRAMRLRD